jgi:predicted metal-dependent hydrolase
MAKRGPKQRRSKPPAKLLKLQSELPTKGQYHNLLAIYNKVNRQYFAGKIRARISWGRKSSTFRRPQKTIKMGVCYVEESLIVIHRALDCSWVPRFFVEYIVFHEMLHIKYPPRKKGGSTRFHYAEFLMAEKKFPNYAKAMRWEEKNLYRLLFC